MYNYMVYRLRQGWSDKTKDSIDIDTHFPNIC